MDPENAEYLHRLAEFLAEHGGDAAEMVALARRAVFRSGKKPEYRQTLAQLLEHKGEREAAVAEYRELLEHEATVDFAYERLLALGEKVKKPKKKKKKKRGLF